jgi:hypothetical protein
VSGPRARAGLGIAWLLLLVTSGLALGAPVDRSTWVDHDGRPIPPPRTRKINLYSYMFRQALIEPISHAFDIPDKLLYVTGPLGIHRKREAANVNAYDEVSNSTWFTNRNHIRSVPLEQIRTGPFQGVTPAKPWTISSVKAEGYNVGFQIKDAEGKKWLIKLDPKGFPQLGSGAGTVVSRLVWAAGYNIALYQSVTFRREDLQFETKLASARPVAGEDPPLTEADVTALLNRGAQASDGRYTASASLYLPGKPAGPTDLHGRRGDDPNDWYRHTNRRELRGLYVFYSWLNNWDVKDQQTLDMYGKADTPSPHLTHYLLDVDGSLGAAAEGAKPLAYGYENRVDFGWTLRRLATLGFVREPWRSAPQETGIPSVGHFEAKDLQPKRWAPLEEVPPFRKMTVPDAYWGAKLVASFTDAQIAAALDAAHYEDPRAARYLLPVLIERRDKVARYWFSRVAPLDFFTVESGTLRFHDLALDRGYTSPRQYEVEVHATPAGGRGPERARLSSTSWALPPATASVLALTLRVAGSSARPVRVELQRHGSEWFVARVRHA